jgi:hypothetical protein
MLLSCLPPRSGNIPEVEPIAPPGLARGADEWDAHIVGYYVSYVQFWQARGPSVHKKNPGRSRKGQHKTDQGFYRSWLHHPRPHATVQGRKAKAALVDDGPVQRGKEYKHYKGQSPVEPRPDWPGSPATGCLCTLDTHLCTRTPTRRKVSGRGARVLTASFAGVCAVSLARPNPAGSVRTATTSAAWSGEK